MDDLTFNAKDYSQTNQYSPFNVDARIKNIEEQAVKNYEYQKNRNLERIEDQERALRLQQVYDKKQTLNDYLRSPPPVITVADAQRLQVQQPPQSSHIPAPRLEHTQQLLAQPVLAPEQHDLHDKDTEIGDYDDANTVFYPPSVSQKLVQPVQNQAQGQRPFEPFLSNQRIHEQVPNQAPASRSSLNEDFNLQQTIKRFGARKAPVKREFIDSHTHAPGQQKKCKACATKFAVYELEAKSDMYQGLDVNRILLDSKVLLGKARYAETEALLQDVVDKKIEHSDVYYMLGETKRLLGKFKEAEFYLLQAMQFELHSPYALNSLALVYMTQNRNKRAIMLLKKYLEYKPQDDKACFNLGRCLANDKDFVEAAIFFTKAIDISSHEPYFYLHRGDCYEAMGFTELAVTDYRRFKQLKPDYEIRLSQQIQEAVRVNDREQAASIQNYLLKLQRF